MAAPDKTSLVTKSKKNNKDRTKSQQTLLKVTQDDGKSTTNHDTTKKEILKEKLAIIHRDSNQA